MMLDPHMDCRRKPDSDPNDVCPQCGEWLVFRTMDGKHQACSDPLCKASHGFRINIDHRNGRYVVVCADVDGRFPR